MWQVIAVNVGMSLLSAGMNYMFADDEDEEERGPGRVESMPEVKTSDPIPVVFGTVDITDPAILYWTSGRNRVGDKEYQGVGMHAVLCAGPVDWISEVHYSDSNATVPLFEDGGAASDRVTPATEGTGVKWHFLSGSPVRLEGTIYGGLQTTATPLDADLHPNVELANSVGFRHVVSFSGFLGGGAGGLGTFRMRVCRIESRSFGELPWYPEKLTTGGWGMNLRDMNCAHIIHECLTDQLWGMGVPIDEIDDDAFRAAADTLYAEEIMISGIMTEKESVESFIQDVLRYCNGALYQEPTTGKWVLKIADDSYTASALPLLDDSNSTFSDVLQYAKSLPTRVTVTYSERDHRESVSNTDPLALEMTEAITHTDPAAYEKYGEIEETSDYPMCKNADLASRLATRDLIMLTTPIAPVDLKVHHSAGKDLRPGDVVRHSSTAFDVNERVLRITSVDLGTATSKMVKVQAVEDAWSFDPATYPPPDDPEWTHPFNDPSPASPRLALELPLWLAHQAGLQIYPHDNTTDWTDRTTGFAGLVAGAPTDDAIDYDLYINGSTREDGAQFVPELTTVADLAQDDTTVSWTEDVDLDETRSALFQLGDELMLGTYTAGVLSLERGFMDTVPPRAAHPAGSTLYLLGYAWSDSGALRFDRSHSVDFTARADASTASVRALTRTPRGQLTVADAPIDPVIMDHRAIRPLAPCALVITDNSTAEHDGSVDLTWDHRNRFSEPIGEGGGAQARESGATYTVRVYGPRKSDGVEVLFHTEPGILADTWSYQNSDEIIDAEANGYEDALAPWLRFEVEASRTDGGTTYISWQYQDRRTDR